MSMFDVVHMVLNSVAFLAVGVLIGRAGLVKKVFAELHTLFDKIDGKRG